jgi:hypothetical protein
MKALNPHWLVICSLFAALALRADPAASLDPHLEALRPLLEKTWKGQFKDSKPDKPTIDVARWERALNGKAIRMLHSINDGAYGGETLFVWDDKKQTVVFYYFTTAGFMTTGTLAIKDGKFITTESVSGNANGVTEIRGTSEIGSDAAFHVKSEYLKNGDWVPGHEVTYREAPDAKVNFK